MTSCSTDGTKRTWTGRSGDPSSASAAAVVVVSAALASAVELVLGHRVEERDPVDPEQLLDELQDVLGLVVLDEVLHHLHVVEDLLHLALDERDLVLELLDALLHVVEELRQVLVELVHDLAGELQVLRQVLERLVERVGEDPLAVTLELDGGREAALVALGAVG